MWCLFAQGLITIERLCWDSKLGLAGSKIQRLRINYPVIQVRSLAQGLAKGSVNVSCYHSDKETSTDWHRWAEVGLDLSWRDCGSRCPVYSVCACEGESPGEVGGPIGYSVGKSHGRERSEKSGSKVIPNSKHPSFSSVVWGKEPDSSRTEKLEKKS